MPSEEMVFMKRMIFPFLIKVRPSLRDSAFSLRFPVENFRMVKFSTGKTLRKRRDGRKRDSEGENCDRRSACATRKRTVREPLFMPYPGMRPLSSPAVVKALLLPLHCMWTGIAAFLCILWMHIPHTDAVCDYISACCHVRCRKMEYYIPNDSYRTIQFCTHCNKYQSSTIHNINICFYAL